MTPEQEETQRREIQCDEDLNKLLAERNCQMVVVVQIGEQWVTVNSILSVPIAIVIGSK